MALRSYAYARLAAYPHLNGSDYTWLQRLLKQEAKQCVVLDADSSCSSNRASALHSPDATRTEVGDSLSLLFPSSTTQLQQSPKMLSTAKPSHWSNTVSETINNPPYTQPFFDTSGKTPLTKEVSAVSEADISMMNLSFDDLFVDIQVNDGSLARTSLPSFPSLFNSYLEAHEALTFIRSGSYELPIGDLKHDRGAMGLVTKINELGARAVNSPFPGSNDQCCLQLAFLAVVKGCELAEQISIMVLPSTRTPLHSSCMDFSTMKPPYGSRHDASPMDNDPWITGPLAQSDHSKPSAEHITALVRLDVQLSKLNSLLSKFIQSTPEHMPLADVLAARCRRRLSYLHTQIRGVVDSMIPAWD